MAVYVFNLLVGWVHNGVDTAQGYRARLLRKNGHSMWYVFTDLPGTMELSRYEKAGIDIGQMLSMYQYFTDNHTLEVSVTVADKLKELKEHLHYTDIDCREEEICLFRDGMIIATVALEKKDRNRIRCIYYFEHGKLIRKENYTDGISYIDYYVTAESSNGLYAKLVRRTFCNSDGSVAYNQIFDGKEIFLFPDGKSYTKVQMIAEFVRRLNLSEQDTVLIDRSAQLDFVQPLFQYGNKARFIAIVHSGHYFEKGEDPDSIYLNKEYYYWFKYLKWIDTMVVSTEEQREELIKKLQEYHSVLPNVEVISAGGIDYLRYPTDGRKQCSLLAVSRIHPRKKVDWIVKSIIKAHQINSDISIDIYGGCDSSGYLEILQNIVTSNNAQAYIRFMGYMDVREVYKNYEVFITASLWETLGLSTMEAIGSGTAVIGLNVKYGNRLFVHSEENGYLVDFDSSYVDNDSVLIDEIARKIVDIFADKKRLDEFHKNSYKISQNFLSDSIRSKWEKLLSL